LIYKDVADEKKQIYAQKVLWDRLMASPTNIRLGCKSLPGKKHSCLLWKVATYGRKKFYNIDRRSVGFLNEATPYFPLGSWDWSVRFDCNDWMSDDKIDKVQKIKINKVPFRKVNKIRVQCSFTALKTVENAGYCRFNITAHSFHMISILKLWPDLL